MMMRMITAGRTRLLLRNYKAVRRFGTVLTENRKNIT